MIHNVVSALTTSGSLSENSTALVKSGARMGTATGTYVGVRTDGRGQISNLDNCGVWDGDSGGPVWRWAAGGVQAVGIVSSKLGPDGGYPAASYCGNSHMMMSVSFAWVHVLQAATGATVVTTST